MPAALTQVMHTARRTEYATHAPGIDRADILFGVVKSFNQRGGRHYSAGVTENLFEAVKAFNARRP
jgi:hypothetical protein